MTKRVLFGVLVIIAIVWSCDPKDIVLPAWNASLIFPIIDAGFDFNDVTFQEDVQLLSDNNGALTIIYTSRKDTLRLVDLLNIPNQEDTIMWPPLPNGLADIDTSVMFSNSDLDLPEGSNIDLPPFAVPELVHSVDISDSFIEATFQSGELGLTITNNFPFPINAGMEIELVNQPGGDSFISHVTNQNISSGATYIMNPSEDLADKTIEGNFEVSIKGLATEGGNNLTLDANTGLGLGISLHNIKLKKATLILKPFESPQVDSLLTFHLPLGAELKSVNLNSAIFSIDVIENIDLPISLRYTFPGVLVNGVMLESEYDLQNSEPFSLNLENTSIDFTDNGRVNSNSLRVYFNIYSDGSTTPITIDFEKSYSARIDFRDIKPQSAFGYLGNYKQTLREGMGVDFFNRVVSGSIAFANPQVIAIIENELGLSIKLENTDNLYISGRNERLFPGQEVNLKELLADVGIDQADFPGDRKITEIRISGDNDTQFDAFISLLPDTMDFSFPLSIGTEVPDYNQFIIDTSTVVGGMQMVLPLELKSNNLVITDTINFDLDVESDYAELVSGYLNLTVTNYFPLEFLLQGYVLDSTLTVIDSLFLEKRVVNVGQLNAQGKVNTPFKATFTIEVGEEKLKKLQEGSFIRPELLLNTSSDDFVRIFDDTKIFLKLNGDFNIYYRQN